MSTLNTLQLHGVRSWQSLSLTLGPNVNYFWGSNGVGKTSVLEAVHFLATAQTFRAPHLESMMHYQADSMTVHAKLERHGTHYVAALERAREGKTRAFLNGDIQRSSEGVHALFPFQLIASWSFDLLLGAPLVRRHFMDRALFHMKPDFLLIWRGFKRALSQRNALLKRAQRGPLQGFEAQLAALDQNYVMMAERLTEIRSHYCEVWEMLFQSYLESFWKGHHIRFQFSPGHTPGTYAEQLKNYRERDRQLGYTQTGPHRADIKLTYQGYPLAQTFSRGQQKLVICALQMAQADLHKQSTEESSLLLIDDLVAELDQAARQRIASLTHDLFAQILITGVEYDPQIASLFGNNVQDHDLKAYITEMPALCFTSS